MNGWTNVSSQQTSGKTLGYLLSPRTGRFTHQVGGIVPMDLLLGMPLPLFDCEPVCMSPLPAIPEESSGLVSK